MGEVYVHGVVRASEFPEPAPPARTVTHGDLAALVTDVGSDQELATSVLRTHWRVLEAAGADGTVIPVRFGTAMSGDRAVVEDFLVPRREVLETALSEMAGKVQLTVKGFYDEDALMRGVVERSPAIAKLRERVRGIPEAAAYYERIRLGELVAAEVEEERRRDAARVIDRLAPCAVATSREGNGSIDSAVNAAFLVERDRIDDFSRTVGVLGEELSGRIKLRYVGPLPPYSFTQEQEPTWA